MIDHHRRQVFHQQPDSMRTGQIDYAPKSSVAAVSVAKQHHLPANRTGFAIHCDQP